MTKEEKIQVIAGKKLDEIHCVLDNLQCGHKIPKKYNFIYLGDIQDYIKYYSLIIDGEFKDAYRTQWNMNTNAREGIYTKIFNFIDYNFPDNDW